MSFNAFDIILAGCFIAILCTFCNIQPLSWLPTITSASSGAPGNGQADDHEHHAHHHHHHHHHHHETEKKMADGKNLVSVDFEVFGRVQGVFFRKFTTETARKHGLVGWVKNTSGGTVVGVVQGPHDKVELMKKWLRTTGSPKSRIDKAEFKNEGTIDKYKYTNFIVKK